MERPRISVEREYGSFNHATNLAMRGKSYELSYRGLNIETEVVESLALETGLETIIDIGTGPGWLLFNLLDRYNHRGRLIGVDPVIEQFDNVGLWRGFNSKEYKAFMSRVELLKGRAQALPVEDNTADRVVSSRQMYYVPRKQQNKAMHEIKRVMKDDGRFVLVTSGPHNKIRQREFEKQLAEHLGAMPPRTLNSRYDSWRAFGHLPKHFDEVQHKPLHDHLVCHTEQDIDKYLLSLESMKDYFHPIPRKSEFQAAVNAIVLPKIYREIETLGQYVDYMEVDIFECRSPLAT